MSFEEQQRDELEALSAIYADEYELINNFRPDVLPKFSITIDSEEQDDDSDEDKYQLTLLFAFPKTYPDIGPEIEILSSINLEDRDELEILDDLNDMVPDNLGLVMVFTLVSKAQEWLNLLKDRKVLERKEAEERRKRELEEAEHKKFEGTRVTVESFVSWKLKFDTEMQQKNKSIKKDESQKMTGKEMFMTDKNLVDSDLSFPDDNDDAGDVKVDESLFEDLEIEEDLE